MTDTTVAPQGSAPAAAPANEAVINPNPVTTPTPIGQQAPDKPVGDLDGSRHRPESRREAIQRAFDRASHPPPKDEKTAPRSPPKAAEAKPGHNRPPEPTPKEESEKPPQHREQGRFARAPDQQQPPTAQNAQSAQSAQSAAKPAHNLPEHAPYREPPPRMADHAKAEWAGAPESVRGEVYRMHQEFEGAYRRYRGDHETMNTIRHFHEMAT